jgi:predicted nuclease of predicted toxin-antitoxin system
MIRLQADADLNRLILRAVHRLEPGVSFRTAKDEGLSGLSDPEVLARAADSSRILVTHDQKTMPRHFGIFWLRA